MASTRTKNTPGNYSMEQWSHKKTHSERMYIHASQGQAIQTNFPGNGLLSGKCASRDLATNSCDIESFLFGIGSTNLVNPLPAIKPNINTLPSLNMIEKIPMIQSRDVTIEPNQRPMYLN